MSSSPSSESNEQQKDSSNNNSIKGSQAEHYDRVSATLRASSILTSGTGLLFGFLLNIIVNPPVSFTPFDKVILLISLYTVAIASTLFIMPVIYQQTYYERLNTDRFLLKSKKFLLRGSFWLFVSFYLDLGLALDSQITTPAAFGLAFFPFAIMIYYVLHPHSTKLLLK
jgi:hypothetical protein